jgi:hypothetical protein
MGESGFSAIGDEAEEYLSDHNDALLWMIWCRDAASNDEESEDGMHRPQIGPDHDDDGHGAFVWRRPGCKMRGQSRMCGGVAS